MAELVPADDLPPGAAPSRLVPDDDLPGAPDAPSMGRLEAGAHSAAQGVTLGLSDELRGAGAALDRILHQVSLGRLPSSNDLKRAYTAERDKERKALAEGDAAYPIQSAIVETLGGLALPGGAAKGAFKAAGLGRRAIQAAKAGGVLGGTAGVGYQESAPGELASAEDVVRAGGRGAAGGAILGGLAPVAAAAGGAAGRAAGRAVSSPRARRLVESGVEALVPAPGPAAVLGALASGDENRIAGAASSAGAAALIRAALRRRGGSPPPKPARERPPARQRTERPARVPREKPATPAKPSQTPPAPKADDVIAGLKANLRKLNARNPKFLSETGLTKREARVVNQLENRGDEAVVVRGMKREHARWSDAKIKHRSAGASPEEAKRLAYVDMYGDDLFRLRGTARDYWEKQGKPKELVRLADAATGKAKPETAISQAVSRGVPEDVARKTVVQLTARAIPAAASKPKARVAVDDDDLGALLRQSLGVVK